MGLSDLTLGQTKKGMSSRMDGMHIDILIPKILKGGGEITGSMEEERSLCC